MNTRQLNIRLKQERNPKQTNQIKKLLDIDKDRDKFGRVLHHRKVDQSDLINHRLTDNKMETLDYVYAFTPNKSEKQPFKGHHPLVDIQNKENRVVTMKPNKISFEKYEQSLYLHNKMKKRNNLLAQKSKTQENNESIEQHYTPNKRIVIKEIIEKVNILLQKYDMVRDNTKLKRVTQNECSRENDDKMKLSKLVIWTQSKLLKIIENIYSYIFKQVQINQKNGHNITIEQFKTFLKHYLFQKYKTEKLCKQNFINLTYSFYYNLYKHQKEKSEINKYFFIFNKLIAFQYNTQELLYYLYLRNIVEALQIQTLNHQVISQAQIRSIIPVIANHHPPSIEQYIHLFQQNHSSGINVHSFYIILIDHYLQQKEAINHQKYKGNLSDNPIQKIVSHEMLRIYEHDDFWHMEKDYLPMMIINTQFDICFKVQLEYQVNRLIQILCQSLETDVKRLIAELLMGKMWGLIKCIFEFNRQKIMKQIGISTLKAKNNQLPHYFRQLQSFRSELLLIINKFSKKTINNILITTFLKKLLTWNIISDKLYQLIQFLQQLP